MSKTSNNPAGFQMRQGMTLPEKVIEHIAVTDTALQKAAAFEKAAAAKQAKINELIPQVVDTMVKFERVRQDQRDKLAAMLQDPVKVLELMMSVAGHRNADEIARLGSGVAQTKVAGAKPAGGNLGYDPADSLTNPNVGARTTRVKQSSVSLFKGLGLAAPTE